MKKKADLSKILVENSSYRSTWRLKRKLVEEGLLEDICSECGIGCEWNGRELSLQLDHINGDNSDNRIENLRILCPNCHSQTETYAGKNTKGKSRVEHPELKCITCGKRITKQSKSGKCAKCVKEDQRVVERPDLDQLRKEVEESSYLAVSRKYGVSDNTIRKWIKTA